MNRMLVFSVLGWLPCALAGPALLRVPRADPTSTPPLSSAPVRSHATSLPHSSFSGTPTITGALNASSIGTGIPALGVPPDATTYPSDGGLHAPQPAPFVPAGGVGTNGTTPVYNVRSDFDYQSLVGFLFQLNGRRSFWLNNNFQALVLYAEWIELDLFHHGLARFSDKDFIDAGLTAEDRFLIQFMADQEVGHVTMLSNILGPSAPQQCIYNYPFTKVLEFVDFCQKLTRFAESGVYGFLAHLDSREAATLLGQAISTEARQQMIFRQFEGLFPVPVWFEAAIPQSWAWTLLAPYISSCPANQTRLVWQNFPALEILNQPNPGRINGTETQNATHAVVAQNATVGSNETITNDTNSLNSTIISTGSCQNTTALGQNCHPGITHNRTLPLSWPGRQVWLSWDTPGKPVGPNNSYITSSTAGSPRYVAWATQLNVTYSALTLLNATYGYTIQPNVETYAGDPAINGTMFIAVTDSDLFVTPFNISFLNPHVVAGPALYQAG